MMHPVDYEAIDKLFRGADIPDDLVNEYEIWQKMASAYGHVGALGMQLVIPMLRQLGYGKVVEQASESVSWRKHIGEAVLVSYDDRIVPGKLVEMGLQGKLGIELEGVGYIEAPRYTVKLAPTRELEVVKDAWGKVKKGAKVAVSVGGKTVHGKFVDSTPDGVRVKAGVSETVYPPEAVELVA
jgi:hypothetical protein